MKSSFKPGRKWKDTAGNIINAHGGGFLRHQGVYYWYGEHKIDGELGNAAWVGVHVYSSTDLYNWKDEGLAFSIADNLGDMIFPNCIIERPKVLFCEKTGQFVMWFHYEESRQQGKTPKVYGASGVAFSDSPTKGFKLLRVFKPLEKTWPANIDGSLQEPSLIGKSTEMYHKLRYDENTETPKYSLIGVGFDGGQDARDQTLFLDDDGKAYHIYSSEKNSTTHIARLTDDFLGHTGEYHRVFENRWMEAPCIWKRSGKYYFIGSGCTGWKANASRSAVAHHIFGPWTELGNPAGESPWAETTFDSQSTYVLQVHDTYIYIGDRWRPQNAMDGRYVWLPIEFKNDRPMIAWNPEWKL